MIRRRATLSRGAVAGAVALFAHSGVASAAGTVGAEVGGGQTKPNASVQSSTFEYQKVTARYYPTDIVELGAQARLTHDIASASLPDSTKPAGSDWVFQGTVEAGFDVSRHVTVSPSLTGAPPSSRDLASSLTVPDGSDAVALTHARNWNAGGTLDVEWDSAASEDEPGPLETTLDFGLSYAHFSTEQRVTEVDAAGALSSISAVLQSCGGRATPLCQVLRSAANRATDSLNQVRVGATLTETLFEDTDLTLDAGYDIYDRSPGGAGFFSSTTVGPRGRAATGSYGAGLPIAPVRWSLRPEAVQRIGVLSLRAYYEFSEYALTSSSGHNLGGKLQIKLGPVRPYLSGNVRFDDFDGASSQSWMAGAGLSVVFR